ncbi:MAG: sulfotransferase [Alkalimonas sp.]|nr:sulfotransferase [Saccharospirillum sp.]MCH8536965.1 sulfotransferase [Alkalimonas sp.]
MAKKHTSRKKSQSTIQYNSIVANEKGLSGLNTMRQELQKALDLINSHESINEEQTVFDNEGLTNAESLLGRCEAIVSQVKEEKPTIRVIHHFACSGGTLISKCIAAQPNVFILSELHPTTRHGTDWRQAVYTPRDIITQAIYGGIPQAEKLAEELFIQDILKTEKHVREMGGYLVIRAHSHADYCMNLPIPKIDTVTRLLEPSFNVKQLVTVRNPIDSFLSLRQNKWVHFKPDAFDEYCRRLVAFLDAFASDRILKYEDFVSDPEGTLKLCMEILDLPSVNNAFDYIDIFKVSGDSGRSGAEIKSRPRKTIDKEYSEEINSSLQFKKISKRFGYC